MRGKHQMTTFSQSKLSDDIIIEEILTRLPVQSVVRFKSVSKKWYSTLSSSDFATAHLNNSPFNRPCDPIHTLLIASLSLDRSYSYYAFPFDDSNRISVDFENDLVKLDVDFGDDNKELTVVGSCNGLICLARNSIGYAYFFLWNPAICKLNKYDGCTEGPQRSPCEMLLDCVACGFGYVSGVDDYKFVRIVSRGGKEDPHPSSVHVFSCRRNKWTKIDFDLSTHFISFGATLVNEKLYWPSCSKPGFRLDEIMSFDLGVEKFNIFHYPTSQIDHLGIMGECLCKLKSITLPNSEIGDMIDILMPPTILKSITLPKDLQDVYPYGIVGFTRDEKFLVTGELIYELPDNPTSSALYLVNIDTEPLECSKLMELEGYCKLFKYVPSLILPFPIVEP